MIRVVFVYVGRILNFATMEHLTYHFFRLPSRTFASFAFNAVKSKIGMDAAGAENAFRVENAFEFLVDRQQIRRQPLDAQPLVAATEQGGVAAGPLSGLERK